MTYPPTHPDADQAAETTTGRPRHRTWHLHVDTTPDGRAIGLCGWISPTANTRLARSRGHARDQDTATGRESRTCPDCQYLMDVQKHYLNHR